MVSVFRDSGGVIMIDSLEKGKTIHGQYYASGWRKLKESFKLKRWSWRQMWSFFRITSPFTLFRLQSLKQSTVDLKCYPLPITHWTYSFDFFVFPKLNCLLPDSHFRNNNPLRTRMLPTCVMVLQCLSIVKQSTLMSGWQHFF